MVELLKMLMERHREKLQVVLDGLPTRRTKAVQDHVVSTRGRLELHKLPKLRPDLNPDETEWSHAKRTGRARRSLRKGEKQEKCVEDQLVSMAAYPKLVRSFFRHPSVSYALTI